MGGKARITKGGCPVHVLPVSTFRAPPPSDAGEVEPSNVTPVPYTVLGTEAATEE